MLSGEASGAAHVINGDAPGTGCHGEGPREVAMFESALLLGTTERSIVVQTHRGRDIQNSIEPPVGDAERRKYERLLQQFGQNWVRRKPATGVYNCAGHVWASRRTSIFEESEYEAILKDDGYRQLEEGERPLVGDLVLYRDQDARIGFLHVGIIVELRPGITAESPRIPWVLSKWDSASGEVLHQLTDAGHFYRAPFAPVAEYWTERPA
jgi:hypothetical protein